MKSKKVNFDYSILELLETLKNPEGICSGLGYYQRPIFSLFHLPLSVEQSLESHEMTAGMLTCPQRGHTSRTGRETGNITARFDSRTKVHPV
jgi:hypothetical protein